MSRTATGAVLVSGLLVLLVGPELGLGRWHGRPRGRLARRADRSGPVPGRPLQPGPAVAGLLAASHGLNRPSEVIHPEPERSSVPSGPWPDSRSKPRWARGTSPPS